MKVTITQDNGEEKKFSCEALALVAQEGKNTTISVIGSGTAVQWTCILAGLDDAKKGIEKNHPSDRRNAFRSSRSGQKEGGRR